MIFPKQRELTFFNVETSIPGFTVGTIESGFQSMRGKIPGDSLTYNDLAVTILLDEELKSYMEVYEALTLAHDPIDNVLRSQEPMFDGILFITTNKNNVSFKITFFNMWIETVSDIQFMTTSTDDNNLSFTIGTKYDYYVIEKADN